MEIGHQNYDKNIQLELELFLNLGPPERQCETETPTEYRVWMYQDEQGELLENKPIQNCLCSSFHNLHINKF